MIKVTFEWFAKGKSGEGTAFFPTYEKAVKCFVRWNTGDLWRYSIRKVEENTPFYFGNPEYHPDCKNV